MPTSGLACSTALSTCKLQCFSSGGFVLFQCLQQNCDLDDIYCCDNKASNIKCCVTKPARATLPAAVRVLRLVSVCAKTARLLVPCFLCGWRALPCRLYRLSSPAAPPSFPPPRPAPPKEGERTREQQDGEGEREGGKEKRVKARGRGWEKRGTGKEESERRKTQGREARERRDAANALARLTNPAAPGDRFRPQNPPKNTCTSKTAKAGPRGHARHAYWLPERACATCQASLHTPAAGGFLAVFTVPSLVYEQLTSKLRVRAACAPTACAGACLRHHMICPSTTSQLPPPPPPHTHKWHMARGAEAFDGMVPHGLSTACLTPTLQTRLRVCSWHGDSVGEGRRERCHGHRTLTTHVSAWSVRAPTTSCPCRSPVLNACTPAQS
jgi:hypothetical protein